MTAPWVPASAASSDSKARTHGPVVSQSLVRTFETAATSSVVDRLAAVGEHAQSSVSSSAVKSSLVNHSVLLSEV